MISIPSIQTSQPRPQAPRVGPSQSSSTKRMSCSSGRMPRARSEPRYRSWTSSGRRLQQHLVLEVVLQPEGVLAVAAVGRPDRGLDVGDPPGVGAEAAQQRGRVERARADLGVVRRRDQAALVGPVPGQSRDHILEARPRHDAGVYPPAPAATRTRLTVRPPRASIGPGWTTLARPPARRDQAAPARTGGRAWSRARTWSARLDRRRPTPPPDPGQRRGRLGQDARSSATGSPAASRPTRLGRARRRRQRPGALLALPLRGPRAGRGRRSTTRPSARSRAAARRARPGLSLLINAVAGAPAPRTIIAFDDYHAITEPSSTRRSPSWCEHLPESLRLVMTTPHRPADRPRAAARARRPRRDPLRRPALQRRRGRRGCCATRSALDLPAGQVRAPARPHRGLGRRPLPRRAVAARPRRRRRLHRRLRRRRPHGGRLPGRRGAGGPGARAPRVPAAHLDPRAAHRARSATRWPRPAARRGCWPSWSARTCSWCRSTTGASGTATTTSSASCCATS